MKLIPGYTYGIRFARYTPSFLDILGVREIVDTSPDVAFFTDKYDAEDMLLKLAADPTIRILEQNISHRYPQRFGSDNPKGNRR